MKKILGIITVFLAFAPSVYADETTGGATNSTTTTREPAASGTIADKAHEVKDGAKEATHEVGKEMRKTGHAIKKAARKTRQAVIVRCADGRHALKRKGDCDGHGGVQDPE